MVQDIYKEVEELMKKALEALRKDLASIRTGRANAALLDGIRVSYYGKPSPINQVANISIPESKLIIIQPWDQTMLTEIEKAILKSDLGLVPTNDGKVLKIPIPELTEERRHELVKVVHKVAEKEKISIRNVRRDGNEKIISLQKEKKITEDEKHKAQTEIQKMTDKYIERLESMVKSKENEILKF
ncbi:MAG: ribosome recycling factor [Candidatus Schekmanbacteria bacterium RBG_16_38_11]|uniref:Ribosome-recycling factor n=2 Tax=Candidatus Schekmaniibacteriota TaxID=1817811 RepID=A0A1F7RJW4_9BACT|nr:MAG: ribosome recycling factor [Candidatus Schekmanbacteria bacterium GWA2_38_11]OGL44452.1 MAG: ribosome recycling factor [Candidatus Schekmanbacteria bacterium RBG_16_38_11]